MNITIGSISLNNNNAPKVKLENEYYRTEDNIIIGGKKNITVSGVVFVADDGNITSSKIMTQLQKIRSAGTSRACLNVNIPGYYTGIARLVNINIEQGSDPSWVNVGAFTISLEAPLDAIPENKLGITASDFVKSLTFSERVDVGEDGHGYVYTKDNQLGKSFVRFSCKVTVEVDPICSNTNINSIVDRFLKSKPKHPLLSQYSGFTVYLADRTFDITGHNTGNFSTTAILVPGSRLAAHVTLDFKHTKNYSSKEETKTISGSIKGLVEVPWSSVISLASIDTSPKIEQAEKVLNKIKQKFDDIKNWDGINSYELFKYPNCPVKNTDAAAGCLPDDDDEPDPKPCFLPLTSTVGRSRTEGSIDFTFEWNSLNCNRSPTSNSTSTEINVEDSKSKPTIAEHIIPTIGILYQDLNCYTARRLSFTSTLSLPENICFTGNNPCANKNKQEADLNKYILQYMSSKSLDPADYLIINYTYNRSNRQNTLTKGFISLCDTSPISEGC